MGQRLGVVVFIHAGVTSALAHRSTVTAVPVVSLYQTKRYVDIWSKAAIG